MTHHPSSSVLPPSTIGILGGGQLGRMLALQAREMGYRIITLDPTPDSPCGQVVDEQIVARFNDLEGARRLAQKADVITYEFENIDSQVADQLERESELPQGYHLLHTSQNRLREKRAIEEAGGQVAPYARVTNAQELDKGIEQLGYPAVLKTTEGGYDGKGQWVIHTADDLQQVQHLFAQTNSAETSAIQEWILEKWLPFTTEISCMVARNAAGETEAFPIAENIHENNILHLSIAPARIPDHLHQEAKRLAIQLAKQLQLVGLLGIELFVLNDGDIVVNEIAPRPHNSGHYTQQACHTSQFEQHIRAVCNLPLAKPKIVQPTVMVNLLGRHVDPVLEIYSTLDETYKLHLYGKKESKPNRKMGHLNVLADDVQEALHKIKALNIWNMEEIE